jgi:hypothetical protein
MSELTSCLRMSQAGAIVVNWAVVCAMLQADWRRGEVAGKTLEIFGQHLPFYGMLANNQRVSKSGSRE